MSSLVFLILFLLDTAIHLAIIPIKDEKKQKKFTLLTKPLLMPFLALYYALGNPSINTLILVGVILGWVGDVTLIFPKIEACFLIGLASFLIGHVLYIVVFIQSIDFSTLPGTIYISLIGYVIFFVVVWRYLKGSLGEMKIPVLVYMTLILTMSFFSLGVMLSPAADGVSNTWLPFVGSLLFIASDTMLANQLFKEPFKNDQMHIMWTYIFAQFCIAQAFI